MKHLHLFALILALIGCEIRQEPDPHTIEKVGKAIEGALDYSKTGVNELQKVWQVEYDVFTFAGGVSDKELKAELNRLGAERWNCFHVERIPPLRPSDGSELRVFCKRTPETPFRYLPRTVVR